VADPELARDVADTAAKGGLGAGILLLLQKLAVRWGPHGGGLDRRVERLEERFEERVEKALGSHAESLAALRDRQTRTETVVERLEKAVERLETEARK
jgi:archaellum component FlaC